MFSMSKALLMFGFSLTGSSGFCFRRSALKDLEFSREEVVNVDFGELAFCPP